MVHFDPWELDALKRAVDMRRRELLDELAHTESSDMKLPLREEIDRLEWIELKLEGVRPDALPL